MNQPQQMYQQPPQQMYQPFPQGLPCNICGFINAPDDAFCKQCGAPMRNNTPVNAPAEVVCPNCGTKLEFDLSDLANALNDAADEDEDQ